jgi:hypothetical protein
MTTTEFSNEFDILYDNVASKGAPGLDLYEKSVFLTKAQLEIVKNRYMNQNKYQASFDGNEKRRIDLKQLIKNYETTVKLESTVGLSNLSKFYELPDDLFLTIQEQVIFNSTTDTHVNDKVVKVIPKTFDEYNVQIKNPFKKPDNDIVWRLDFSKQDNISTVEILSIHDIKKYQVRYIKFPSPIILTSLIENEFTGMELSINNETIEQTSELEESIHDEILNRAVELAVRDYKESTLQSKVQLNLRDE